ncbi:pilus assembly protein [Roseateles chitinivorans]|uniref:Pilus assembly protein n=1 Tax=Roseateles chitinivorans TaxID=2917965 RepID=A0A2G9CEP4_9BURK|nr:pilus assembly protein [Roseateles chitinivorans]PIM53969.1 pilus assembly protein [Roseateles chitinivorans]
MMPTLRGRLKASLLHFTFTLIVAASVAAAVFLLWYPWPYSEVSGGTGLFLLIVGVDAVLGPLITLVVFDRRKPPGELWRDMTVVVALQLAGLAFGAHTMFIARPVVLALEGDRFRAVIAASVIEQELPKAPESLRSLSMTGPRLANTRDVTDEEKMEAIFTAFGGADLGMRPSFWQEWDGRGRAQALRVGKPVTELLAKHPAQAAELRAAVAKTGKPIEQLIYIPMLARRTDWSVLLDRSTGDPIGFAAVDGF